MTKTELLVPRTLTDDMILAAMAAGHMTVAEGDETAFADALEAQWEVLLDNAPAPLPAPIVDQKDLREALKQAYEVVLFLCAEPSGPGEGCVSEKEDTLELEAWNASAPEHFALTLERARAEKV